MLNRLTGWALHHLPWQLWQRLYSWRLDRQLLEIYSQTKERWPQAKWIPHPHKDHSSCQSSSVFTPKAWQIWTKLDPARLSHWQIGSHTKHQGTPRRQLKQCNNWIVYPSGCHDTKSLISPDKAQTLWCTLNNRAAVIPVPVALFDGAVDEWTSLLRFLGIHFNRMLTYRKHVETTVLKCKKGLSALKATAAKSIELHHLFLLYQMWCPVSLTMD